MTAAAPTLITKTIPGVNVAGYLTAESGVGTAARGYVRALERAGVAVALNNIEVGISSRKHDDRFAAAFADNNPYPINLICVNADQLPGFVQTYGKSYFEGKYNIGVWWWELPDFPQEYWQSFSWLHEIWVGSWFIQHSLSRCSPIPVVRIPPSVTLPDRPLTPRNALGLPQDEFLFLFMFDFLSVYERKNPLAVIHAFLKAFQSSEPVRLILKCINSDKAPEKLKQLQQAIGEARVTLMDQYLSPLDTTSLMAACDSYVSLHRSEGLGLPLVESMMLHKPVIATGWSGNSDFMTAQNSYPVPYKLVLNEADALPYQAGELWAQADVGAAAQAMRDVYSNRDTAALKAAQAAIDAAGQFSQEAVASLVSDRLIVSQSFHPDLFSATGSENRPIPAPYGLDELVERQLEIISSGGATAGSETTKSLLRKLLMPVVERAGYLGSIYSQLLRRLFSEVSVLKAKSDLVDNRTRRQLADADARIRALEEEVARLRRD